MQSDHDLERLIDRELAGLPAPRAPRTLAPRVMRAVSRGPRAEIGAWFTWPLLWQASSFAVMALVFAGAVNAMPFARWALGVVASASEPAWLGESLRQVSDVVGAAGAVWCVLEPVAIVMLVVQTTMVAASAAFGAALRSVVLGGTSRP